MFIWTINFNNASNSRTNAKTIHITNRINLKQLFVDELFIGSAQIAHVEHFQLRLSLSIYDNLQCLWVEIKEDFFFLPHGDLRAICSVLYNFREFAKFALDHKRYEWNAAGPERVCIPQSKKIKMKVNKKKNSVYMIYRIAPLMWMLQHKKKM